MTFLIPMVLSLMNTLAKLNLQNLASHPARFLNGIWKKLFVRFTL